MKEKKANSAGDVKLRDIDRSQVELLRYYDRLDEYGRKPIEWLFRQLLFILTAIQQHPDYDAQDRDWIEDLLVPIRSGCSTSIPSTNRRTSIWMKIITGRRRCREKRDEW